MPANVDQPLSDEDQRRLMADLEPFFDGNAISRMTTEMTLALPIRELDEWVIRTLTVNSPNAAFWKTVFGNLAT
jgi:hypothetical protein